MAEEAKLQILIRAKDEATKTLDKVNKKFGMTSRQMKIAGGVMVGSGLAIGYGLVECTKAAAEEEAGIVRLSVAMENMGLSYEDTRESLEAWIDAEQQKTSIADNEQRDSLAGLVRMTGDMGEAQDLLTLAMDMSVGLNEDLESSTRKVMYAMGGNWGMVERYIPALKECATEEEKWMKLREMFAGQAEEYGKTVDGQMKLMQNNIGDIKEALGTVFLPVLSAVLDKIKGLVLWLKNLDPRWQKVIAFGALAAAGLLIVGGGLLLVLGFLPTLAAGFGIVTGALAGFNIAMLACPLTWIVLAIAAVIVAIVLLVKHWDWVKEKLGKVWEFIKTGAKALAEFIMLPFIIQAKIAVGALNWMIRQLNKLSIKIPAWVPKFGGKTFGFNIPELVLPFAKGGLIKEPTMMYGLRTGRVGIAGEAGPERIVPEGEAKSIINNFNIANLVVREEADVRKIAKELYWLQNLRMRGARA